MITVFNRELTEQELIMELKDKNIINKQGQLKFTELVPEYRLSQAKTIYATLTIEDIYKSYSTQELRNLSLDMVNKLRYDLINHIAYDNVDMERLSIILDVLHEKKM